MGYRSDVAYVIEFEDVATLNEFIALVMAAGDKYKVDALKECGIDTKPKRPTVGFYAYDVKWYENYFDVQAHEWLLAFARERFGDKVGYKFTRIGEDVDDIEEREEGDVGSSLYVNRNLEWDFEVDPVGDALGLVEVDSAVKSAA